MIEKGVREREADKEKKRTGGGKKKKKRQRDISEISLL